MVRRASLDLPAGDIKTSAGEILVRTKGRRYFASDYRDVAVITKPDGSKVTLGQIASLTDGFQDVDREATSKRLVDRATHAHAERRPVAQS